MTAKNIVIDQAIQRHSGTGGYGRAASMDAAY
jgi:hypothetical protein